MKEQTTRIIVTGGAGLIGTAFIENISDADYEIIVLSRDPARASEKFKQLGLDRVQCVGWDSQSAEGWGHLVSGDTAIVNLAGENPAHWRWTAAHRQRVLDSRLRAGQAIVQAVERYGPPQTLLQASATGFYGSHGQEILTESSPPGQGWRADVCRQWEETTASIPTRRCVVRIGIVLHRAAGLFPAMLAFSRCLGKQLADGTQQIPWIHYGDVAKGLRFLIETPALAGPVNLCAPEPASNREFVRTLAEVRHQPALIPIPALALRLALEEMSVVVLDSERVIPRRLLETAFQFDYPTLEMALRQLLDSG